MGEGASGVGRKLAGAVEPTLNDSLEKGMERVHGEKIPVQGPTPSEVTMEWERKGAAGPGLLDKDAIKKIVTHVGTHVAAHKAHHFSGSPLLGRVPISEAAASFVRGAGAIAGRALTMHMAYELSHLVTGDSSRTEFTKAQLREQYGQATALLAGNALPRAYVDSRTKGEPYAAHTLDAARESLRNRLGSDEKAEVTMRRFQAEAERGATAGMEHAAAYELRSPAQRDALLTKDKSFRERFATDLAFREGVNAMVWLGEKQPAEFESRRALFAGQSAVRSGQVR